MPLLEGLLEHPLVYRLWQQPFADEKFAPVVRHGNLGESARVLDVGCGPGTNARYFTHAEYVGLDINERYLAYARARYRGSFLAADLRSADLEPLGLFDTVIVNSFLHHIDDDAVDHVLAQAATRLAERGLVHVLELVLPAAGSRGRLMARLDRGRYPRSCEHWTRLFERPFTPVRVEPYRFGLGCWQMLYFQGRKRA